MSSSVSVSELVIDAGPLIALARLDAIRLAREMFDRFVVTGVVVRECLTGRHSDGQQIQSALEAGVLELVEIDIEHPLSMWNLDRGEATVIGLAARRGMGVLVDDRAARRVARNLGLPLIGTCGLLLLARRQGRIEAVTPMLEQLVATGYYLDQALIDRIRRLAGEA